MSKLINAYRTLPSPKNRERLQAYINKHIMALCLAAPDEIAFLKANEFKL
jgi:hypothetical protein